jgi:hypothetical protein
VQIPFIAGKHKGCTNASSPSTNANATDSDGLPCRQFDPPCHVEEGWTITPGGNDETDVMGACSGNWIDGAIVDQIVIPAGICV